MKNKIFSLTIIISICSLLIGMGTFAYLTDSEVSTNTDLTAGDVEISIITSNNNNPSGTMYATFQDGLWIPGMQLGEPGGKNVTVKNTGSLPCQINKIRARVVSGNEILSDGLYVSVYYGRLPIVPRMRLSELNQWAVFNNPNLILIPPHGQAQLDFVIDMPTEDPDYDQNIFQGKSMTIEFDIFAEQTDNRI